MEDIFDAGSGFIGNIFSEAYMTFISYYNEKNQDSKYQKLIEKLKNGRKELENRLLAFTEKKIKTSTYIQDKILPKYNKDLLISSIKSIYNEINTENSLKKEIESYLSQNDFSEKLHHFNILILGRAGIGKTTLINSLLEFEGTPNELLTGEGTSKTMGAPKGYTSEKVKGLRLWDSQGIDKEKYSIPKVVEDVKKLINEASINNDPDKFIHCIWYCISGNRFEVSERESISELMSIYDDNTLPIIIVYTEAYSEEITEEVCNEVKKVLEEKTNKDKIKEINIVPIVAKNKEIKMRGCTHTIEKFGIKSLMDISLKKIILAVNSACFFSYKNKLKKEYENKLKNICDNIKNDINKKVDGFTSGSQISQINSLNSFIVKNIFQKLFETKNLPDKDKKMINKIINKLLKNFEEFVDLELAENLPHFISKCISESLMEYKNENIEKKEGDNQDDINISERINKYTLNYVLNIKNEKKDLKKQNIETGGGQEDTIFEKIRKTYLSHIMKIASKYIDITISEEIYKIMVEAFNELVNNYDQIMQNKVKESMNQQSLNVMKEFKFDN